MANQFDSFSLPSVRAIIFLSCGPAIAALLSFDGNITDRSFYLDALVLLLVGVSLLFVRVWAADSPADRQRHAPAVAAGPVLAFLFVKLSTAVAVLFYSDPTGGSRGTKAYEESFCSNVFVVFLAGVVFPFAHIWAAEYPADRAPAADALTVKVVLALLLVQFIIFDGIKAAYANM